MLAVFSDLDGTILDFNTYSYEKALEGINILKARDIPLVPVSSKTFAEMKGLNRELQLSSPFVFENGGGMAFPSRRDGAAEDYSIEHIGMTTDRLKDKLDIVRRVVKTPIKALFEMEVEEIIERTNLSGRSAELARERSTSIPFVLSSPEHVIDMDEINLLLKKYDIVITKGGRFYHFSSIEANKGNAVRKIIGYLKSAYSVDILISIGIGDSENDIPMLEAVDIPFLVRRHDNSTIETTIEVTKTEGIGPAGFTEAIISVLSKYTPT